MYCAAGNPRFAATALAAGYQYGAQLPGTTYAPIYFADQNWKQPNRAKYMARLATERPVMATVLDWEREDQLPEVLAWATEAAQWVQRYVLIVPKVMSGIPRLPRHINGATVVLAYSVPTRFGGTSVPIWEFAGWPIHLLGGSPQAQMHAYLHLHAIATVISADGNYAQKMATRYCQFWAAGTAIYAKNRYWPTLTEADGARWPTDGPYEAFRRSCTAIVATWKQLLGATP